MDAHVVNAQSRVDIWTLAGLALLISLFNPLGIFITLVSAVASSFGGTAGLFNVAYARPRELPVSDFAIGRQPVLLVAGVAMTVAFAAVLGPTISLG